jgi:eukaryotic-like serine/threonine-protein kinase
LSDLRFSPNGDRIAYFEHPRKFDDRGSVDTVDLAGHATTLSDGYWSLRGLSWSPDGGEILFSASETGGSYTVYGVTMSGKRRVAYQPPGGFIIQDVARDGRWLATRLDFRYAAMVHTHDVHTPDRTPGRSKDLSTDRAGNGDADRDLSWLNTSHARALSQDGQRLLFSETSIGKNYAACLRKTDGGPVLRLGEGWPSDLSADGKWVLAVVESQPPKLLIYPTGAGETRPLARGNIEHYTSAVWFRDGKRALISGNEPGKGARFYVQDLSGIPKPVTPEGTRDGLVSADGKLILARGLDGKYSIYPIAVGDNVGEIRKEPQALPALTPDDVLALWNADGRWALVYRRGEIPYRVERVDLAAGHRTLFKELAPPDRTGLLSLRDVFVSDDLRSYAYTAYYQVSSLFVSEGEE